MSITCMPLYIMSDFKMLIVLLDHLEMTLLVLKSQNRKSCDYLGSNHVFKGVNKKCFILNIFILFNEAKSNLYLTSPFVQQLSS